MKLTITPTKEDYYEVARLGVFENKKFKTSIWFQRLTLPIIAMLLTLLSKPIIPKNVIVAAAISVVWFFIIPYLTKRSMSRFLKKQFELKAVDKADFLTPYTIEDVEEGLLATQGDDKYKLLFDSASNIIMEDDYIYFLQQNVPFDFLIPSHAFETKEDFNNYKEHLDRRIQIELRK